MKQSVGKYKLTSRTFAFHCIYICVYVFNVFIVFNLCVYPTVQ